MARARAVALLFCDVVGSTALLTQLGDIEGDRLRRRYLASLRDAVAQTGGTEVKNLGDGLMVTFPAVTEALACGVAMQQGFARLAAEPDSPDLALRVGISAGEAVFDDDDWFGTPVVEAARLCSAAGSGQILAADRAVEVAGSRTELTLKSAGHRNLKGLPPALAVSEVDWSPPVPVAVLGSPPRVGGRAVTDGAAAVLGLLLPAEGPVPTDLIVAQAGQDPAALGDQLDAVVVRTDAGWSAAVARPDVDAFRFEDLVTDAITRSNAGDMAAARRAATAALEMWRDPSGAVGRSTRGGAWLSTLAALVPSVLEVRIRADLAAGHHELVVDELSDLTSAHTKREEIWRLFGVALARCGDLTKAAEALAMGADATGSAELRELAWRIERGDRTAYEPPGGAAGQVSCPYKGLEAFQTEDAALFHGRQELVSRVIDRLAVAKLVAIVGPSGSGKSSLVRAGVIPALTAGALRDSATWDPIVLTPGAEPTPPAPAELAPQFVVVDQFEELFTLCHERRLRDGFIARLLRIAEEGGRVLVAIRSDFYGYLAQAGSQLASAAAAAHVLVAAMTRDELTEAISQPALDAGLLLEEGLADAVVADAGADPGALPLVSHAMVETWIRRNGNTLTLDGYREAGRVAGALGQTADGVLGTLGSAERELARDILLSLVETGASRTATRRIIRRDALQELGDPDAVTDIVETLATRRLISLDGDSVQLTHEALITEWPTLAGWVDDVREGLRLRAEVSEAAQRWNDSNNDPSYLFRGTRLDAVVELTRPIALTGEQQRFVDASIQAAASEREHDQRRNRRLRTALTAALGLLVVAIVAGLLAVRSSRDATDQRSRAEQEAEEAAATARQATLERMSATSSNFIDSDRSLATLLAVERARLEPGPESAALLRHAITSHPAPMEIRKLEGSPDAVALDATGSHAAVVVGDEMEITNLATNQRRTVPLDIGFADPVVALAADAQRVVLADRTSRQAVAFDLASGAVSRTRLTQRPTSIAVSSDGRYAGFGGGNTEPGVSGEVWNLDTGVRLGTTFFPTTAQASMSFARNGDLLFTDAFTIQVSTVDDSTGVTERARQFDIDTSWVRALVLAEAAPPDARTELPFVTLHLDITAIAASETRVVSGSVNGTFKIWDIVDTGFLRELPWTTGRFIPEETILERTDEIPLPGAGSITDLAIDEPRGLVVAGTSSGLVALVELDSGAILSRSAASTTSIADVAVAPDGTIRAVDIEGLVTTWRPDGLGPLFKPVSDGDELLLGQSTTVLVAPDGRLTSRAPDGTLVAVVESADQATVLGAAIAGDDRTLVVAQLNSPCIYPQGRVCSSTFQILETSDLTERAAFRLSTTNAPAIALNYNGTRIFTGAASGAVQVRDRTGGLLATVPAPAEASTFDVAHIAPSMTRTPGRLAVVWNNGTLGIWRGHTRPEPLSVSSVANGSSAAWRPDGTLLVGRGDGSIVGLQPDNPSEALWVLRGHSGAVTHLDTSADGQTLISSTATESRVWDLQSRQLLVELPTTSRVRLANADGLHIHTTAAATAGPQLTPTGTWDLTDAASVAAACRLAGRGLTPAEWERYLPADEPYAPSCRS